MPYSTTASPYSTICGANTTSIWVATATISAFAEPPGPSRAVATGPATSASATDGGTSTTIAQVSSADAVRLVSAAAAGSRPARCAGPASTGTTTAVSAPPATMSKMMFGTWLAVA